MITYSDTHDFTEASLEHLFLSVNWSSGSFPDKLKIAMQNYSTVFSAWDGDELVGMICVMDDGIMTAYVHYLLVDPRCQGQGIGRHLIEMVKERYEEYLRIVLVAYNDKAAFYESCGFTIGTEESPMFITKLWT